MNRISCKFCPHFSVQLWRSSGNKRISGWKSLSSHVQDSHPEEHAKIQAYAATTRPRKAPF